MWAITTAAWRLRLPEGLLVDSAVLTESLRSAPPSMWSTVVVPPGWCWSAPRPFGCCIGRLAGWSSQRSLYELEPGQWRDYDAYVGHPGRTPDGMHVGTFDQRVDEWRDRFLTEAATAIGQRGGEFGWHRLLLSGDKPVIR